MDTIKLYPTVANPSQVANSLPGLLQTPSGLAILEIQGSINVSDPNLGLDGADTEIGKLVFPLYSSETATENQSWMKRVYLYVGKHQRLTGEVKKLGKPIAIIKRRQIPDSGMHLDEELEVTEIIRYKILFSQRPEPVGDGVAP